MRKKYSYKEVYLTMTRSRSHASVFGDLSPADPDYCEKVYKRILAGGEFINGRWQPAKCFPNQFWDKESACELVRYFVFKMQGWGREEVCKYFTTPLLRHNRLAGVCKVFDTSTYTIVNYCFPEWDIKPWELATCPNDFWSNPVNRATACVWVCQKEGIADDKDLFCKTFSVKMLQKYGVGKACDHSGGLYEIAKLSFPDWNLKPWELKKISKITESMVIEAVRWMIDEKLGWTHEEVCEKLCVRTFYEHGIGGILSKGCNHSPIVALKKAYPDQYERKMLKNSENPFLKRT